MPPNAIIYLFPNTHKLSDINRVSRITSKEVLTGLRMLAGNQFLLQENLWGNFDKLSYGVIAHDWG